MGNPIQKVTLYLDHPQGPTIHLARRFDDGSVFHANVVVSQYASVAEAIKAASAEAAELHDKVRNVSQPK